MPKLGITMEEGTVVAWLVELHGRVERGEPLLVIESEKAEVEIEATASGVLRHIYVDSETTVPCGTLLAAITGSPDEAFEAEAFRQTHDLAPAVEHAPSAPPPAALQATVAGPTRAPRDRKPIAPAARKRARDLGIDAQKVPGTGPGGRVTRQDVDAYAQAREALVEVGDGVALEVLRQGEEEGDAVLLLPGFGTDVSAFTRQIPALAQSHRVIGLNPRGVGLSDAPEPEIYAISQAAADAAAVLARPAHVVGTSLGAAVAMELALAHPEAVRSLALITPFVAANGRLLAVADAWTQIAAVAGPELLARALLPWLFSAQYLEDGARRERTARGLAATLARVPPPTLRRAAAGMRDWSGTRSEALQKIAVPTLVLAAGDDLLTPDAATVAAAIPDARLVSISGAGHALGLEAPDAVNESLLEHLAVASRT
jgi:pyruvate dehydrogenase E2 component (dihydrolipoamide acetyltransferase)